MDTTEPSFKSPPITEMVIGVRFAPIRKLDTMVVHSLWSDVLKQKPFEYTEYSEQMRFEIEEPHFGPPLSLKHQFTFQPGSPRHWFLSEDSTEVVQLQDNWILCNWRERVSSRKLYPGFDAMLKKFSNVCQALEAHLLEKQLLPAPFQCQMIDVTYINHVRITDLDPDYDHSDAHRVVTIIPKRDSLPSDLAPDQWGVSHVRFFKEESAGSVAKLETAVSSVWHLTTQKPALAIKLIYRDIFKETTLGAVFDRVRKAHREISQTFQAVTTPEAKAVWARGD